MPNSNEPCQTEQMSLANEIQRVFINIPVVCIQEMESLNEYKEHLATKEGLFGLPLLQKNVPDVEKKFHDSFDFVLLAKVLTKHCNGEQIVGRNFDEAIAIYRCISTYHFHYLMVEASISKRNLEEDATALKIKKNIHFDPYCIISVRPIDMNQSNVMSTFSGICSSNINDFWLKSLSIINPNTPQINASLAAEVRAERTPSSGSLPFFSREAKTEAGATAERTASCIANL